MFYLAWDSSTLRDLPTVGFKVLTVSVKRNCTWQPTPHVRARVMLQELVPGRVPSVSLQELSKSIRETSKSAHGASEGLGRNVVTARNHRWAGKARGIIPCRRHEGACGVPHAGQKRQERRNQIEDERETLALRLEQTVCLDLGLGPREQARDCGSTSSGRCWRLPHTSSSISKHRCPWCPLLVADK